jgi:hypothetical protein
MLKLSNVSASSEPIRRVMACTVESKAYCDGMLLVVVESRPLGWGSPVHLKRGIQPLVTTLATRCGGA